MDMFNQIIKNLKARYSKIDEELIVKAYKFMLKAHEGQYRASGQPYSVHPLEVSLILSEINLDVCSIAAAFLHDILEDTEYTKETLIETFNYDVYKLVEGVTKITKIEGISREVRKAETIRKIIISMSEDLRVIIIKLADRLHNMRTLKYLSPERQIEISLETMDIFVPLANRLGIAKFKWELEDLAFSHIHPEMYKEIAKNVANQRKKREKLMDESRKIVQAHLDEQKIKAKIFGRVKHFFSIYKKMNKQGITFSEVYDLLGIRIITESVRDCYAALGLIHTLWRPIPGRFKDYLAIPKPNKYQSIHTTVIGPHGTPLEIQIRTKEMDYIAEVGVAAHWHYKEKIGNPEEYSEIIKWTKQVLEQQQGMENPLEFVESLKIDLFPEEVRVFTPKGEPMAFPAGSTPIDFAYAIHTEVGHSCIGAKVNSKLVPLKYQLQNGDMVEIQTAKNHGPPAEWLNIAKTPRATSKIRHYHKVREREMQLAIGKEMITKEAKRSKINIKKLLKSKAMNALLEKMGFKKTDDLFVAIAYGKVSSKRIINSLADTKCDEEKDKPDPVIDKKQVKDYHSITKGIRIEGSNNILVRLARCCNPIPGDFIKGFVTLGKGISVHRTNCVNFMKIEAKTGRVVDVFWDNKTAYSYPVNLTIIGSDRPGLLADITNVINKKNINILIGQMKATEDKLAIGSFIVEVQNIHELNKLVLELKKIRAIKDVKRDTPQDIIPS